MIKKYFWQFKYEFSVCLLLITLTVISTISASVVLTSLFDAIMSKSLNAVLIAIVQEIIIWLILLISNYFQNRFQSKLISKTNNKIKEKITQQLTHQPLPFTEETTDNNFASKYVNDCELIEENVYENYFRLFYDYEIVFFSFISLLMYNVIIALCTIVFFLIIYNFPKLFEKLANQITQKLSNAKSLYLNELNNQINGYSVYEEYNHFDTMATRINNASTTIEAAKLKYQYKMNFINLMMGFSNVIAQLGTIIATAILASLNMISASAILSIGNLSGMFYNALAEISNLKVTIKSTLPLLLEFENTHPSTIHKKVCPQINQLELKNLSFNYNQKIILNNLNFVFQKGNKYLIVGKNGSGKTTLLKLLSAKLQNYNGSYCINGIDVKTIDTTSINDKIAFIHQNPYLFNDSLLFNLTLGQDFTEDAIYQVVEQCKLNDFVETYGYDYIIETNSSNISAGQKQKIAIARALLRKKQVILIDEATANLDEQSKSEIIKMLFTDLNRIVIMIDHQLSENDYQYFDTVYHL